jgi:uncharacterized membrane protein
MFKDYYNQANLIFNEIIDSFNDPQRLHATIVHLPIVLSVLTFVGVVMLIFTLGRSHRLRWGTAVMALLAAGLAWYATETGEAAEHAFNHDKLSEAAHEALEQHEFFAEYLWVGLIATSLILMISAANSKWVRSLTITLALLTSLATVAWVSAAAHYGGQMVYEHGVGVPATPDNITHLGLTPDTPQPTGDDADKPDAAPDGEQPGPNGDEPKPDGEQPRPEDADDEERRGNIFDFPNAQ